MSSASIVSVFGREIFDSRGNPTVEVEIELECGAKSTAAVPSGASVGSYEALELRDKDTSRLGGKGVLKAINAINEDISDVITGMDATEQYFIDRAMIDLDGTENKSKLGANAMLGVSLAVAKAAAIYFDIPLFKYLGGMLARKMPVPMMNVINGGAHADNKLMIQEFMIIPSGFSCYKDGLVAAAETSYALKALLKQKGHRTNVGDEGGFAPEIDSPEQALDFIIEAISDAGYKPGEHIQLGIDAAASELYEKGHYNIIDGEKTLNYKELTAYYSLLLKNYPIISIEDAMSEHDKEGWEYITSTLGSKVMLIGDDLFVTNAKILMEGINSRLGNAILIKPNQIGTLTETHNTICLAQKYGYHTIMSHRSGETEDTTIAHLAVAFGSAMIKTGALARSERVAKYNELIRIEESLFDSAIYEIN